MVARNTVRLSTAVGLLVLVCLLFAAPAVAYRDPVAGNLHLTKDLRISTLKEIPINHPMPIDMIVRWRKGFLRELDASFMDARILSFNVDGFERYFLSYVVQRNSFTIQEIVRRYAAAEECDDHGVWLMPADIPVNETTHMAIAVHRHEYHRDVLNVGDRILLLVPNIRYVSGVSF